MKKSTFALTKFPSYNCSQAVFSSFAEDVKLDEKTALKISSGFGGGMACAETCGAVTGSYMFIGMKFGHSTAEPTDKATTKLLIQKFNELFIAKHGSLKCKELTGYDISTPEGSQEAKAKDVFNQLCPKYVASACDILEENF